jgi:site-specific DNA-methyltransferase (adenine-specific)
MEAVTIGACRLICGDARDVLPTLGNVDAVVTDPPYGLDLGKANNLAKNSGYGGHLAKQAYYSYDDTYANFCSIIVPALNVAIDHARAAAVFSGPHLHEQRKPVAIGGVYLAVATGRTTWGTKNFLPVLFYGVPPGAGQHRPLVIQGTSRLEQWDHPCMKPLSYMAWLVTLATRPGGVVLDPFMGSGTTGVACVQLGRPFFGIEIEPRYFDIACRRIEHAYAQLDLFAPPVVHAPPRQEVLFYAHPR